MILANCRDQLINSEESLLFTNGKSTCCPMNLLSSGYSTGRHLVKKIKTKQLFYCNRGCQSSLDHCNFYHHKEPNISKRESLLKEYEAIAKSRAVKAYISFCLDEEDNVDDKIDDCIAAELEILKSLQYVFLGSYQQLDSNW